MVIVAVSGALLFAWKIGRRDASPITSAQQAASAAHLIHTAGLLPLCLRRRIGTLNQIVSHITDGAEQLFLSVLPCHTATPSFCKNLRSCSRVRNRMDLTVFSFSE